MLEQCRAQILIRGNGTVITPFSKAGVSNLNAYRGLAGPWLREVVRWETIGSSEDCGELDWGELGILP